MRLHGKYPLIIFVLSMLVTSCFEDQGNYDYLDLDRVIGVDGFETGEVIPVLQYVTELSITPEIVFENNGSEDDLDFKWTLFYSKQNGPVTVRVEEVISTDKNLNYILNIDEINYQKHVIWFSAKSKSSGVEFKDYLYIDVTTPLSKGDFFLYEKNGGSELFLVNKGLNFSISEAYSKIADGRELPGSPLGIGEMIVGRKPHLLIYTDQAPDYGAILDMSTLNYFDAVSNTVQDIQEYDTFDMTEFLTPSQSLRALFSNSRMLINGNFYFYSSNVSSVYKPQIRLEQPTIESVDYISPNPETLPIVHQTSTDYILFSPTRNENNGSLYNVVNNIGEPSGVPVMYPGKCLFIGKEPSQMNGNESTYGVRVLMQEGSAVKQYTLEAMEKYYGSSLVLKDSDGGVSDEFSSVDLLTDNSLWTASFSTRYFYFSAGNVVYRYDYDNTMEGYEPEVFITLSEGSEITYLTMDWKYNSLNAMINKHLVIASYTHGQDNGGSVYYYNQDGELLSAYEYQCGKIVGRVGKE